MVETKTKGQQLNGRRFPIITMDSNGNILYWENYDGSWTKYKYDSKGNKIYEEESNGFWYKQEFDSEGNIIYYKNSKGVWEKMEYDSNGNEIYYEGSEGGWIKREFDSNGNIIYYENSYGYIEDNRNIPELPKEELSKEELSKEESPEETLQRLIKDNVVLKATKQFGCSLTRDIMKIVLNGNTMTDEYYSKLMDVTNVINKLHGTHFIVTIEYPHFSI